MVGDVVDKLIEFEKPDPKNDKYWNMMTGCFFKQKFGNGDSEPISCHDSIGQLIAVPGREVPDSMGSLASLRLCVSQGFDFVLQGTFSP